MTHARDTVGIPTAGNIHRSVSCFVYVLFFDSDVSDLTDGGTRSFMPVNFMPVLCQSGTVNAPECQEWSKPTVLFELTSHE